LSTFEKIHEKHTSSGFHEVIYKIDFDGSLSEKTIIKEFVASKHYPFNSPYGDHFISVRGGDFVLIHRYDTSG
jgi:hypothetical protein